MSNANTHHISDLETGLGLLAQLPLAYPAAAEEQMIAILDALLIDPPDAGVLLTLLEQMRVPMGFVEEEMARRYHNKPLPLAAEEDACFTRVISVWRRMVKAYALCASLEEPDESNPKYATLMATLLHRCLYYTGMIVIEHYRARRELPPGIWLELHGYYESAEEWGVACTPVEDVLENTLQATHCAAAYVTLMLVEIASPYSNSVRNLNLIRRWAGMWAPLVSLHRLEDDLELPPYIVELMKDQPLHQTASFDGQGNDVRRLDTTRLGLQINHMLGQLRQRITPSQLGLGEETSSHVITMLDQLSRPWTQSASPRKFRRFASEGLARVTSGFEAMHFVISGGEFVQPDSANAYSRKEFDQLFTFRDRADPTQALTIKPQQDFPIDDWQVINHSANGFRLGRSGVGQKVAHGQLLAVCPHDGDSYLLTMASWLMQEAGGDLIVGVAILPGMPTAVGVRPETAPGGSERFVRAFLLPALPAIGEAGSLVLPSGIYQASRAFDLAEGEKISQIRMKNILQRGTDFDRVSFEPV
jgi:hypothetical protein